MKVGFIGSGEVATAIARYVLKAGHQVVLSNSSDPKKLAPLVAELGEGASSAAPENAAIADIVILAVPWTKVKQALSQLPHWNDRILIDATNPFLKTNPAPVLEDLGDQSSSEIVASLAPGARVVKAFNSVTMRNFKAGPVKGDAKRVLLVAGNDEDAKASVKGLITQFGFAVIDLGPLKAGKAQQAGFPLGGLDLLLPA